MPLDALPSFFRSARRVVRSAWQPLTLGPPMLFRGYRLAHWRGLRGLRGHSETLLLASAVWLAGCNQILGNERPLHGPTGTQGDPGTSNVEPHDAAAPSESDVTATHSDSNSQVNAPDAATPQTCTTSECAVNESWCTQGAVRRCERDRLGCLVWSDAESCPSALCADATTCYEASTSVTSPTAWTSTVGDGGTPPSLCTDPPCAGTAGTACKTDDECVEGTCQPGSDGSDICCTASCDAPCLSCAPNGHACSDMADDARCGEIPCPADTTCRNYRAELAIEDRCVDGVCGAAEAVCGFVARNENEPCGGELLCDDTGNCSAPKFAQGAECEIDEQCTTEHCANGVCCESDCDGVCMDCRPGTGKCDVVPADDPVCPQIDCEADYFCSTWISDISNDRCARLGACKSDQDCVFEYAPKGTLCYVDTLCDGQGECAVPEVECGVKTCETNDTLGCCAHTENAGVITPECTDRADCIGEYSTWHLGCDEHSDCDIAEQLCCAHVSNSGGYTECSPTAECNHSYPQYGLSLVELCDSPAMGAKPCSTNVTCNTTSETLPGYTFCRLPD
jgi:hypothetical protein